MRIVSVSLFVFSVATMACASGVSTRMPDGWNHGSSQLIPDPEFRRGFRELLLCHAEPYPSLNTTLFITVVHGPARSFLAGYLSVLRRDNSDLTVVAPIQESSFANAPATYMEVKYTKSPPINQVVHTRSWVIPSSSD